MHPMNALCGLRRTRSLAEAVSREISACLRRDHYQVVVLGAAVYPRGSNSAQPHLFACEVCKVTSGCQNRQGATDSAAE